MKKMNGVLKGIIIVVVLIIVYPVLVYFAWTWDAIYNGNHCASQKVCPDGSYVKEIGRSCEYAQCPPLGYVYKNVEYSFELSFPQTWKGYTVIKQSWEGRTVDTGKVDYNGIEVIIKNPQTTTQQKWQDVPIMVFTPDVWKLISEEKVAVSAAPIPPEKIGENSKYVFATPPRWYGFTDDKGWQEAVDIVKTFKAF